MATAASVRPRSGGRATGIDAVRGASAQPGIVARQESSRAGSWWFSPHKGSLTGVKQTNMTWDVQFREENGTEKARDQHAGRRKHAPQRTYIQVTSGNHQRRLEKRVEEGPGSTARCRLVENRKRRKIGR